MFLTGPGSVVLAFLPIASWPGHFMPFFVPPSYH